jgi:hypothetical protein
VCTLVKETAEIEIGMAEKSSWDQANIRQKLCLVGEIERKISQIIKDYFYLPLFLLIILWHICKKNSNVKKFVNVVFSRLCSLEQ